MNFETSNKVYTYIDLFSGPGGLCTGFKNANFKPLIAIDISDKTVETYRTNHDAEVYLLDELIENQGNLEDVLTNSNKTVMIHGDIRKVNNKLVKEILKKKFNRIKVDVVAGGPPCESFSMAGDRMENDDRDDLFASLLRIAHCVESKFVFFENVPGLLSKKMNGKKGELFRHIVNRFETPNPETGNYFKLTSKEKDVIKLKAADFGVPQIRKRIFLIGVNSKYGSNPFKYPEPTHGEDKLSYVTVNQAIQDLPVVHSGGGDDLIDYEEPALNHNLTSKSYWDYMSFIRGKEDSYVPSHINFRRDKISCQRAVNHRDRIVERFKYIKPGEGMKDAAERLIRNGKENIRRDYFPNRLYNARNRRLKGDKPSFTVTSHCLDEMVHPTLNRQITPREAARLQSFPDWYDFKGKYVIFHGAKEQDKYEQIGDAIPVLLVKALAEELYSALDVLNKREKNK